MINLLKYCQLAKFVDQIHIFTQRRQTSFRRLKDVSKRSRHFKTKPARRLKKDVGFTTPWRRLIYDVLRMSDFQSVEDVWSTAFWRSPIYVVLKTSNLRRLCSNVLVTSIQTKWKKKWFFPCFVLSEIFRKF